MRKQKQKNTNWLFRATVLVFISSIVVVGMIWRTLNKERYDTFKAFQTKLDEYTSLKDVEQPSSHTTHKGDAVIVNGDNSGFHPVFKRHVQSITPHHPMLAREPGDVKTVVFIIKRPVSLKTYSGQIEILNATSFDPLQLLYSRNKENTTLFREDSEIIIVEKPTRTLIARTIIRGRDSGELPDNIEELIKVEDNLYELVSQGHKDRIFWHVIFQEGKPFGLSPGQVFDQEHFTKIWDWIVSHYQN